MAKNLVKKSAETDEQMVAGTEGLIFEFPCGLTDENQQLHKEFEIREMDGTDEEALQRGPVKNNGAKIVNTLLERCVLRIGPYEKNNMKPAEWQKLIKSLTIADQDFAVIQIRRVSIGDTMTVKHRCPHCGKEITTELMLDELEVIPFNGEHTLPFALKKGYKDKDGTVYATGRVRFPNGLDREILAPVVNNNPGVANTLMLARIVTELGEVKINDAVVRSLTSGDRQTILSVLTDNKYGINFEIEVTCPECGDSFTGALSSANFI